MATSTCRTSPAGGARRRTSRRHRPIVRGAPDATMQAKTGTACGSGTPRRRATSPERSAPCGDQAFSSRRGNTPPTRSTPCRPRDGVDVALSSSTDQVVERGHVEGDHRGLVGDRLAHLVAHAPQRGGHPYAVDAAQVVRCDDLLGDVEARARAHPVAAAPPRRAPEQLASSSYAAEPDAAQPPEPAQPVTPPCAGSCAAASTSAAPVESTCRPAPTGRDPAAAATCPSASPQDVGPSVAARASPGRPAHAGPATLARPEPPSGQRQASASGSRWPRQRRFAGPPTASLLHRHPRHARLGHPRRRWSNTP